jgi:Spy/CpxP family protein refolding chaperone
MFSIAAAALLMPVTAMAQDETRPEDGMRGSPGVMQQNTIEWLLTRKEEFRPTGEQVARLEAISKQLTEANAARREELRKTREEAMNGGDRRASFEKLRPVLEELRKQDEAATKEALTVLNDEQKKVVEELLEARRKEMQERRGRMGNRRGGGA